MVEAAREAFGHTLVQLARENPDIVVLDADGGVCVRRERLQEVLQASEARLEKEANMRERLLAGETSFDIHGLRNVIDKDRRKE